MWGHAVSTWGTCVCVCVRVMCRHMCVGVVGVGPCGVCVGVVLCAPVCPTQCVGVFPVEQIFSPPEPSIPGWLLGPLEGGLGAQVPRCLLSRAAERQGGWGTRDSQQGPAGGQPHAIRGPVPSSRHLGDPGGSEPGAPRPTLRDPGSSEPAPPLPPSASGSSVRLRHSHGTSTASVL